jgi:hypothetical protein
MGGLLWQLRLYQIKLPKTAWLMILFLISLAVSRVSVDNNQTYNRVRVLAVANQTVFYVLPAGVSCSDSLGSDKRLCGANFYYLGCGVSAVELTKNAPGVICTVGNVAVASGLPVHGIYAINKRDLALNTFAAGRDPAYSYND